MSTAEPYGEPATRRRILDATWELIEGSDPNVTIGRVARHAGVSRQAVYLHFGDRSGLLVALVDHIDESLGRDELRAYIHGAPTGVEGLRRWVEGMSWYTAKIDRVTRVLEHGETRDEALAAAWRDRMNGRRGHIRRILERVGTERLRDGWTLDTAVDAVYAVTMPGPWRELVREQGWTAEQYAHRIWALLQGGLLTDGSPEVT